MEWQVVTACSISCESLARICVRHRVKHKVKVKLSLCFNQAPRLEGVLGEWRYSYTPSLTSALDGGEWSASRPGRFTPRVRAPSTPWIRVWVGPRAGPDAVANRKVSSLPLPGTEPQSSRP